MKLNKDFFHNSEVLFVGYSSNSSKNAPFSRQVYKAFVNGGLRVYPMNNKDGGQYDVKVYKSLDELQAVPKTAYILLKNENTLDMVKKLGTKGVSKILFQSKKTVSPEILGECSKLGIETAVACPMMIFGSGLHRFHAFMAGVKR